MVLRGLSPSRPSAQQISTISELFEASIISSFNSARRMATRQRSEKPEPAQSVCPSRPHPSARSAWNHPAAATECLHFASASVKGNTVAKFPQFPHLETASKTHEDGLQAAPVGLHLGPDAKSSIDGTQLAAPLVHHGLACGGGETANSGWLRILPHAAKLQNSMKRPCEVMPIISSESLSNFSITSPGPWQGAAQATYSM